MLVVRPTQMVDVFDDATARRERHDAHSRRVAVDGEVGQQLLHKLELVEEVLGADARRAVDEEDELGFAVGGASQVLHVSLQHLAQVLHLHLTNLLLVLRIQLSAGQNHVACVALLSPHIYPAEATGPVVAPSEQFRVEHLLAASP